MGVNSLRNQIENVDIYLLDQILKGVYVENDCILDAGCGHGRNLKWFYDNNYNVHGVDADAERIAYIKERYAKCEDQFSVACLEELPYEDAFFDHVICSAVLHFAKDESHFFAMFHELLRVLKPGGTLFIRVASSFGIEDEIVEQSKGVYLLPDESHRFLLTPSILAQLLGNSEVSLLAPVKTVLVHDLRCMTTLMLAKK